MTEIDLKLLQQASSRLSRLRYNPTAFGLSVEAKEQIIKAFEEIENILAQYRPVNLEDI